MVIVPSLMLVLTGLAVYRSIGASAGDSVPPESQVRRDWQLTCPSFSHVASSTCTLSSVTDVAQTFSAEIETPNWRVHCSPPSASACKLQPVTPPSNLKTAASGDRDAKTSTWASTESAQSSALPSHILECVTIFPTKNARMYWPNTYKIGDEWQPEPPQSPFSISEVWSFSLCRRPTPTRSAGLCHDCDVTLRATRLLGCEKSDSDVFSHDEETLSFGRRYLGPDELKVLLEGPEHLAGRVKYLGQCTYEYFFRVFIPGAYALHVSWSRSDWNSVRETETRFWPGAVVETRHCAQLTVLLFHISEVYDFSIPEVGY